MIDSVIEFNNVSKAFVHLRDRPKSMKSILVSACRGDLRSRFKGERKIVLQNVSFKIRRGETVGIMGRNGTGKSTLLRMLCGIYQPDSGQITVTERIAPLIALGAGFHPDLSGYENIYLSAAILGIPRSVTKTLIPEILQFAELGDEIYDPVKNYSSGMMMRLGFSVASHLDAPILVLDEVLSVGDEGFQKKCFKKIDELFRSGRTVILVTHDPKQVKRFCQRCLVFENGSLLFDGDPEAGTQVYSGLFAPPAPMPQLSL